MSLDHFNLEKLLKVLDFELRIQYKAIFETLDTIFNLFYVIFVYNLDFFDQIA